MVSLGNMLQLRKQIKANMSGGGGDILGLSQNITMTVGTGGDYGTLNEALLEASKFYPLYVKDGVQVTINLLTGFVLEEQIILRSIDLSFCKITSVDAIVPVKRDTITETFTNGLSTVIPTFGGVSAKFPVIDCLFQMDTSGVAGVKYGFVVWNNSVLTVLPGGGFQNATLANIATRDAYVSANRANFDGNNITERGIEIAANTDFGFFEGVATGCTGNNVTVRGTSRFFAQRVDLSGCNGTWAADLRGGCVFHAIDGEFQNATQGGIRNEGAAYIYAPGANLQNIGNGIGLFSVDPTGSNEVAGGTVVMHAANLTGTTGNVDGNVILEGGTLLKAHDMIGASVNVTVNTLDAKGIWFG